MNTIFNFGKSIDPWNKGKLVGQKPPLKLKEIWAIRVQLQLSQNLRNLALFNLAIDSKLRGCDLVKLRVNDISQGGCISNRATLIQQKTNQPVQFEISSQARDSLSDWIKIAKLSHTDFLLPSRIKVSSQLSARQYARIVNSWVTSIGLDLTGYGCVVVK